MENQNKEKIELSDQEFLEAVKTAGLEKNFKSYLQKEGDRRLTEGLKTYQKNLDKKDSSDSEKIINLENELKELKGTLSKKDIETQIKLELKAQNLSEGLIKYIRVEDPSKIAESVASLKNDLLEIKQGEIDQRLKEEGGIPLKGDPAGAGSGMESVARSYAKKISIKEK